VLSGKFVICGRRLCAILFTILIIISVIPTVVWINLYCISGGRFVYGFATGVVVTCANLILSETVPAENQTSFGVTINLGIVGGLMIILLCGLPLVTMTPFEMKDTWIWMISYAGLPIAFGIASLLMALTCFRDEPIKYLINKTSD
jgi:MFS family permease